MDAKTLNIPEEIKREIFGIEEEDDEGFEDLTFAEEDEQVQFTKSEHDCGMCKCFNTIYDFDESLSLKN